MPAGVEAGHSEDVRPMSPIAAFAALLLALAATASAAVAAPPCTPRTIVTDVAAKAFYVDARHSEADPAIVAANKAALAPLDRELRRILAAKDEALARGDRSAARCAVDLLLAHARGGGMLGTLSSRQAGYEVKWRTAGLAIAWLDLRDAADPAETAEICAWFARLDRVVAGTAGHSTVNNHLYWIGLVHLAVGAGCGRPEEVESGLAIFRRALADIGPDGTLAAELVRGRKALHYHAYALAPLVVMAEIGDRWLDRRLWAEATALHRLAALVLAGAADPAAFTRTTGVPVETAAERTFRLPLAWSHLYARRHPDRLPAPPAGVDPIDLWLGGDHAAMAKAWIR